MEASGSQAARDTESGRAARKELGRGCWDAPRKPARTGKRNGSGVFARRRLSSFLSARRLMQVRRDPTVCGSAMRAPRPCRVRRCRVPNEGQAALQSSRAPHAASPRRIRRDLINSNERLIGANNIGRTLRTRFFFSACGSYEHTRFSNLTKQEYAFASLVNTLPSTLLNATPTCY